MPRHPDLVARDAELSAGGQGFVDGFGSNVDELVDVTGGIGQTRYLHNDMFGKGAEVVRKLIGGLPVLWSSLTLSKALPRLGRVAAFYLDTV